MCSANPDMYHRSVLCGLLSKKASMYAALALTFDFCVCTLLSRCGREKAGWQLLNKELFLPLSWKLNRWEVCKYTDKDMIYCLLSLPVKSSLSFAIFTTGSRNIRTVKKTIISGARSSACQKFRDVSLYITVFSVAYGFLLHYILGLNFIC